MDWVEIDLPGVPEIRTRRGRDLLKMLPEIQESWAAQPSEEISRREWLGLPPELRNRGAGLRDHQLYE